MAEIIRVLYAGKLLTRVYNKPTSGRRIINTVLHGTWLGVTEESGDGWVRAVTAGPNGWVREADTRGDIGLKMFFIDVGQGDAVLIEAPGKRILVDGGPLIHTRSYLKNWQYSFRSDLNGTQFWSDSVNHCTIPGCESVSIAVTIPVTMTVQSQTGSPYPDLPVYVFSGESYTGYNGISDVNGQVVFTLPAGDYRFRSDYDGVQFWSNGLDHCSIPGCLEAVVEIPGGIGEVNVTINYSYDPSLSSGGLP